MFASFKCLYRWTYIARFDPEKHFMPYTQCINQTQTAASSLMLPPSVPTKCTVLISMQMTVGRLVRLRLRTQTEKRNSLPCRSSNSRFCPWCRTVRYGRCGPSGFFFLSVLLRPKDRLPFWPHSAAADVGVIEMLAGSVGNGGDA